MQTNEIFHLFFSLLDRKFGIVFFSKMISCSKCLGFWVCLFWAYFFDYNFFSDIGFMEGFLVNDVLKTFTAALTSVSYYYFSLGLNFEKIIKDSERLQT